MRIVAFALMCCIAFGQSASAGAQPPTDAKSLSEILRSIEQEDGFSHFGEIEWDDDGYWEIEYFTTSRMKVEIKVVPSKQASPAPEAQPATVQPAEPTGSPLTRDACEKASMTWNENANVCDQ